MKNEELLRQIESEFGIGCRSICEERLKQINKHGFTAQHHKANPQWYLELQLKSAAISLLSDSLNFREASCPENWDVDWWVKLCNKSVEERSVISGALTAAELDRIN